MDYTQIFRKLWQFVLDLCMYMEKFWAFLTSPIKLGALKLFGWTIIEGFSFSILDVAGGVLITLVVMALIKTFFPVA